MSIRKFCSICYVTILVILILYMIYPYTSLCFQKPFRNHPFMGLNTYDLNMKVDDTYQLEVKNWFHRSADFESSDYKVADVSRRGIIEANRKGRTIIRVKVGKYVYLCRVKVS